MNITERFHELLTRIEELLHLHPSDPTIPAKKSAVIALGANHPDIPPETQTLIASTATAAAQATPAVPTGTPLGQIETVPRTVINPPTVTQEPVVPAAPAP